jgi:hypothetical protein
MLDLRDPARLQREDLQDLSAQAAEQVLQLIQRQALEIAHKQIKLDKLSFELARHKAWRYGAKTEAMSAEQRALFEETWIEDEAGLQAQLQALRADAPAKPEVPQSKPRRQVLPEHLRRVEVRHEPEDTNCPNPQCRRPMQRVGEDVSEKLDIVPAEFFVQRHVYGKWACRCWPAAGAGAGGRADHRARHARCGAGGAHADQPLRGPPAVLPARVDQCPQRRAHAALDAVGVGGSGGRGAGAAVRGAQALRAASARAARRRDARGDARPGCGQDPAGLCLGLRQRCLRARARRDLRVLPGARGQAPDRVLAARAGRTSTGSAALGKARSCATSTRPTTTC